MYDLLFLIVQHPSDLNILHAYPSWRGHCRKAIVYIEELWTVELKHEKMLRPLEQFDHVLMNTADTVEPLGRLVGRPCDVAHVGVDAIRFCPLPNNAHRVIDFLSMGRRGETTHSALLKLARARDFYYEYDTVKAKHVLDTTDHRELLANRIKKISATAAGGVYGRSALNRMKLKYTASSRIHSGGSSTTPVGWPASSSS